MKRWSMGFISVAAFAATFGFGGLSPVGTEFAWGVSFLFLGISGIALIHRRVVPRKTTAWLPPLQPLRHLTPSSIARATAAWR
jgi:hypothetical protein